MFSVDDLVRCLKCGRRLGHNLFVHSPDKCNACIIKEGKSNVFFPRSQRSQRSVNNTFISREILAGNDAIDPIVYYRSVAGDIASIVGQGLEVHVSTRWILRTTVIFERMVDDILQETRFNFQSDAQILLRPDQIGDQVESAISRLLALILEMSERESDFVFKTVFSTTIELARYNPAGGSMYMKTPVILEKKKALINVQNNDDRCFLYAVASAIHPQRDTLIHPERTYHYKDIIKNFKIKGLKFPLDPQEISKFESLNPDIAVNVLHYDDDSNNILPLVHTTHLQRKHQVNLLLLSEECESVDGDLNIVEVADLRKYHYTWIKHPSRLFYSLTQYEGKVHVCMNCLHRFKREDLLVKHRPNCIKHSPAHITFP